MVKFKIPLALVTALLFFFTIPESYGYLQSQTSVNIQISSGQWASRIGATNGAMTNSPYVVTWTANTRKQYALIALENNGSYTLNASHITFSSAKTNGDATNPPTLIFEKCSGVWNVTDFSCNGTIALVTSATGGQIDFFESIFSGNRFIIRVTNLRDVNANYTTTFSAFVTREDIRLGQVLSS
jgi:hypothetical protein